MLELSFALTVRHGAERIEATIYRYGAPPTIYALVSLLNEEAHTRQWQNYVADVSCMIIRSRVKKLDVPFFSSFYAQKKTEDRRSGEEIRQSVISYLRRRKGLEVKNDETV